MTFIGGEPVLFLANPRREREWIGQIRAADIGPIRRPRLAFTVSSHRRRSQPFDIDNLAKLVLDCVAPDPQSVWVTVAVGDPVGVLIEEVNPPQVERPVAEIYIEAPPLRSKRGTQLPELATVTKLEPATASVGLELAFDDEHVRIGRFDFEGPVKPLIDALAPLLGRDRSGPADHRVHELRITKAAQPQRTGVLVRAWMM